MSFALSTIFRSERKEIFPLHFPVSFTIKLNHVEKRMHLKILRGGTDGSHFAHINLLRASHLISPVELIKVCLNVTAIFKFPIICQQEPCPPFSDPSFISSHLSTEAPTTLAQCGKVVYLRSFTKDNPTNYINYKPICSIQFPYEPDLGMSICSYFLSLVLRTRFTTMLHP